jgi:hypothetical protein
LSGKGKEGVWIAGGLLFLANMFCLQYDDRIARAYENDRKARGKEDSEAREGILFEYWKEGFAKAVGC